MKKILLILPYFGKFPEYFQLFLNSCRENSTIHWLLVTDVEDVYDYPENVQIVRKTFSQFREEVQKKFDFPIALESPYKLCDYKPAYGYIFGDYLNGYDYWGHCDLDLLFGDLRKFFPDKELEKYDKIGHLGHLTLYRNTPEINSLFMAEVDGVERYRQVFATNHICVFDEWDDLSVNRMFLKAGKRLWLWNEYFDAYPSDDNLVRVITCPQPDSDEIKKTFRREITFISWESGKIFAWNRDGGKWCKTELAYAHFQKRAMRMMCGPSAKMILCTGDAFLPLESSVPGELERSACVHKVLNKKRWKHFYMTKRYWLIEKSAPVRHWLRKKIRA